MKLVQVEEVEAGGGGLKGLFGWLAGGLAGVILVVVGVLLKIEMMGIENRIISFEGELEMMREMLFKDISVEYERERRNAETLSSVPDSIFNSMKEKYSEYSEDGVPVVSKKYSSFRPDGTGFRVYNAWYQHRREKEIKNDPRVVVKHATDAPIRAHHRKSAAWSSSFADDEEEQFEDAIGTDAVSSRIKSNSAVNSINFGRNRAKVTNMKDYRADSRLVKSTTTPVPQPATSPSYLQRQHTGSHNQTNHVYQPQLNRIANRNRGMVRSGGRKFRNRELAAQKASRGVAIHFVAGVTGKEGSTYKGTGRVRVTDSVFRDWTPSRWARRMKMDQKISLKDGKATVASPGIYYIYAQINYLDDHDVNAFKIMINDSPFITCTTMTHTPIFTNKANTCYTGGVTYLEQGDTVVIQNMEDNRFAVLLSSHSFFGLVQISSMGI